MTTSTTLEEFSGLLATFKRVVEAGMQANLSASTDKEGNLKAKLEVKFCRAAAPSSLPSKSTVSSPVAEAPGQPAAGRRRKRRGPAARERARARAACYRAAKAAAAAAHGGSSSASEAIEVSSEPTPPPPPPLPPPPATARLIKVVERKASSWPTFSQLDGEGSSEIDTEDLVLPHYVGDNMTRMDDSGDRWVFACDNCFHLWRTEEEIDNCECSTHHDCSPYCLFVNVVNKDSDSDL